jgi:serine/threonine-protein kinase
MTAPPGGQDLAGMVLAGKFKLLSKLGEGGMSTVWRAENVFVHKTVAIKLMHPEYARNERTLDRFRNEATAAGRIGDAHICDILDFGQSELGPFIVMEMLSGESFADLLDRCGRIDPGLAVLIIRQGLLGLAAAHRVGIIHRDLKPENLFLHYPEPGHMVTKLMDFGISKFTEEMGGGKTGANVLMGTPEYMAPEQAEGAANVDMRTDVWAMGVMLYRAISGNDPFRGSTLAATLLAVTTKDPPPLDTVVPGLPSGLGAVVQACLAKSPDARYPTADSLAEALRPYEAAAGTLPPPEGEEHGSGGGHPTMPSTAQADPSLPTFSSANQQLEMARAASLAGEQRSPGASPSFEMGGDSGPKDQATWSNELAGPAGAEDSWSMGGGMGHRPRPVSGGGSGGLIALVLLGLVVLAGGGYVIFTKVLAGGGGSADGAGETGVAAADAGETGSASADVAPDLGTGDDGTTGGEDTTTTEGGDETTAADPTGTSTTGGEAGSESTTTTGSDDGGKTTGGKTTGGKTTGGKTTGGGSGGSGGGVKVDRNKVVQAGNLYTPKSAAARMNHSSALSYCAGLKRKRFAGLRKWRPARVSEIKRFASSGVSRTLYWSSERSGNLAIAVNLMGNGTKELARSSAGARAFCVSSR